MTDATTTLIILAVSIVLFIINKLPVGVVAICTSLALLATGIIDLETTVGGFGDPVVIFIATLFIVSAGLEVSGLTAWAGRVMINSAGIKRVPLLIAMMVLAGLLSALITPNGAAAAMIPVVIAAARRAKLRPSLFMMPMAFAASAGALMMLSGSVVNIFASDAALAETGEPFGFFEFALVGVPLLVGTVIAAVFFGQRLIPDRDSGLQSSDLTDHVGTMIDHYKLERGFFRLRVTEDSGNLADARTLSADGAEVFGVQDTSGEPVSLDRECVVGDVLVVTGGSDEITDLVERHHLEIDSRPLTYKTRAALLNERVGLAEVIVAPRSELIDTECFAGLVRGEVTVLGVRRMGKDIGAKRIRLIEGDGLLLHGNWEAFEALAKSDEVLVVDSPQSVRQQAAPLGKQAWFAGSILVTMVILLATGVVPPAIAGLIGAVLMVLTRVISPNVAYRAVSWQTVVLIGGLIPLSVAVRESGAADVIAKALLRLLDGQSEMVLLAVIFLVTALLGQVISNTATALVMLPIVIAVAQDSGMNINVALMCLVVAASASLLTPISTPANMMIMTPGGYQFGDYKKFGGVVMLVWMAVAVLLVPLVWGQG